MRLIGLGHKARRGKDTVAEMIAAKHDYKVVHFADALYEECKQATIVVPVEVFDRDFMVPMGDILIDGSVVPGDLNLYSKIWEWVWKRYASSSWTDVPGATRQDAIRVYSGMAEKDPEMLQWWGTDYRRAHFGEDYWLRQIEEKLSELSPQSNVVISDVRFPNEAKWIHDSGGVLVRIDRDQPTEDTGRDPNHVSEVALDDYEGWDLCLDNNGSLADLEQQVDRLMVEIKEQYS